ncbi:hypothetical protein [Klebsiella pneumoniae]
MLRGCISCNGETDMTIWEISEKADYIAVRFRSMDRCRMCLLVKVIRAE